MSYVFFKTADSAQDDIWDYTVRTWGEQQAVNYITGLHVHIQALAEREMPWRELPAKLIVPPGIEAEVYFSRYEHHYIFFRLLSSGRLGVVSILHAAMNLPVRLASDLREIEAGALLDKEDSETKPTS